MAISTLYYGCMQCLSVHYTMVACNGYQYTILWLHAMSISTLYYGCMQWLSVHYTMVACNGYQYTILWLHAMAISTLYYGCMQWLSVHYTMVACNVYQYTILWLHASVHYTALAAKKKNRISHMVYTGTTTTEWTCDHLTVSNPVPVGSL